MTFVWPWIFTVHCTLLSSTSSSLLIWLNGLQGGTVVTILDICESLLWFELLGETGIDLVLKKGQKVKKKFFYLLYYLFLHINLWIWPFLYKGKSHYTSKKISDFPKKIFIRKKNKPIFRKMLGLTGRIYKYFSTKLWT